MTLVDAFIPIICGRIINHGFGRSVLFGSTLEMEHRGYGVRSVYTPSTSVPRCTPMYGFTAPYTSPQILILSKLKKVKLDEQTHGA